MKKNFFLNGKVISNIYKCVHVYTVLSYKIFEYKKTKGVIKNEKVKG